MASSFFLILFMFFNFLHLTIQDMKLPLHPSVSISFPLTTKHHSSSSRSTLMDTKIAASSSSSSSKRKINPSYNFKASFRYSMALIVSIPIGTPPQSQQMVLDTGSQLSWIQCKKKVAKKPPPTTSFYPSLSSTFSDLPCSHPMCKPRIPDFTLPTTCDQKRLCHYSYFYADGTLAEGNLVREKFTFSRSQSTPPLILGCASDQSGEAEGILGMNLGRLSFVSQAKVHRFSYCVPRRHESTRMPSMGTFYLGQNPNSHTFRYVNLLTFPQSQRMPNLDPLAYTLPLVGIRIAGKRLNIARSVFRPDAGGSGQSFIDSGTQYTFLVEDAYNKVREEIVRLVGRKMKRGYVFGGALDMCFNGNPIEIGRSIGDMVFEFEKGVEILINKDDLLDDVGDGVHCFGMGRSQSLGVASNIIGNFHQQNLWVEFDVANRRVGFGKAICGKSM